MIDIHCHMLPGIDDGPKTLDQAIELARLAVANGITHAVLTPHIHPDRYTNTASTIHSSLEAFRASLAENSVPLKLGYAGEVRLDDEILTMVQEQKIPFYGAIGGYRVLLLEFPHSHVPMGSENLVKWLLNQKIRPLIAHPERNKGVMRKLDSIRPFVEMGCMFQLTAGSVAGYFGEPAQATARALLENGWVTVLASDAHNVAHRPPRLDHGRDAAAQIVGEKLARRMVYDRPWALVKSQFLDLAKAS